MKARALGFALVGLSVLFLPVSATPAQELDVQLTKLARRPAAPQPAPDDQRAQQEAREATGQAVGQEQRARLLETERGIEQRVDRESVLRDVQQHRTIQRALSGSGR